MPLIKLRDETFIMYLRIWNPGLFDQIINLGQEALGWESIISLVKADFGISIVSVLPHLLPDNRVAYRSVQEVNLTFDLALA